MAQTCRDRWPHGCAHLGPRGPGPAAVPAAGGAAQGERAPGGSPGARVAAARGEAGAGRRATRLLLPTWPEASPLPQFSRPLGVDRGNPSGWMRSCVRTVVGGSKWRRLRGRAARADPRPRGVRDALFPVSAWRSDGAGPGGLSRGFWRGSGAVMCWSLCPRLPRVLLGLTTPQPAKWEDQNPLVLQGLSGVLKICLTITYRNNKTFSFFFFIKLQN